MSLVFNSAAAVVSPSQLQCGAPLLTVALRCREHLAAAQQRAMADQQEAVARFRSWASRYVQGAEHMNVCSGAQVRQLLFAGAPNSKFPDDADKRLELVRAFKARPSPRQPGFAVSGLLSGGRQMVPIPGKPTGRRGGGGNNGRG